MPPISSPFSGATLGLLPAAGGVGRNSRVERPFISTVECAGSNPVDLAPVLAFCILDLRPSPLRVEIRMQARRAFVGSTGSNCHAFRVVISRLRRQSSSTKDRHGSRNGAAQGNQDDGLAVDTISPPDIERTQVRVTDQCLLKLNPSTVALGWRVQLYLRVGDE